MAKFRTCIRCGSNNGESDEYCAYCGAPIVNRCLGQGGLAGDPCTKINESNAAYCTGCGSITAFSKTGLLAQPYPENKVLDRDELEEMNWFSHRFFAD